MSADVPLHVCRLFVREKIRENGLQQSCSLMNGVTLAGRRRADSESERTQRIKVVLIISGATIIGTKYSPAHSTDKVFPPCSAPHNAFDAVVFRCQWASIVEHLLEDLI